MIPGVKFAHDSEGGRWVRLSSGRGNVMAAHLEKMNDGAGSSSSGADDQSGEKQSHEAKNSTITWDVHDWVLEIKKKETRLLQTVSFPAIENRVGVFTGVPRPL